MPDTPDLHPAQSAATPSLWRGRPPVVYAFGSDGAWVEDCKTYSNHQAGVTGEKLAICTPSSW